MASSASSSVSVTARPADEAASVDATRDVDTSATDRGPPIPSQLEETRDGGFAEHPQAPANLAQTMPYTAGDVIANKYRLTKILGEGGMGAVWLARNLALEIDVAIKLIRHDYANAEGAVRLLQEARAAARIGHPCIVRVFDFGTTERADPFIVMEVLQGESLAEAIKRKGRLSAMSAVRTLLPVASALAAAHAKGIVHRDLKPDNIRLVTDDRGAVIPKVVDFGIAKLHHDDLPRETTQAGVILGSPHYMSPEQACGRSDVDHRTDIWAFSVMLYEVVAGIRPFEGPNYNALISSILVFHPAPWDEHDVHEPELWALLQRGLAKELEERWPTMQEYGEALAIWASQRDVETDAAGNSLRAHWLAATMHRPLSEFPPANPRTSDPGRPRLVSDHNIRVRLPSLPELSIPELNDSSPAPTEKVPVLEVTPEVVVPPADPTTTNLPLATSASRPPERRSAAMWIGPLALAVGALVAGALMLLPGTTPGVAEQKPASALSSVASRGDDKPGPSTTVTPATTASAALDPGPAASSVSAASSTVPAPSAQASASANAQVSTSVPPVRTTVPGPKTTKAPPGPPPIPTDPNF